MRKMIYTEAEGFAIIDTEADESCPDQIVNCPETTDIARHILSCEDDIADETGFDLRGTREKFVRQVELFLKWDALGQRRFAYAYYINAGATYGEYIVGETAAGDLCLFCIDDTPYASWALEYITMGWTDPQGFFAGKTLDELLAIALRGDAKPE